MKIINKVTDENYTQWIERFVTRVLEHAYIECKEVIIKDVEPSKRIFILVDGREYTIRTWNYRVIKYDNNNNPCAENVEYTLFETIEDCNGSFSRDVDESYLKIAWNNDM